MILDVGDIYKDEGEFGPSHHSDSDHDAFVVFVFPMEFCGDPGRDDLDAGDEDPE